MCREPDISAVDSAVLPMVRVGTPLTLDTSMRLKYKPGFREVWLTIELEDDIFERLVHCKVEANVGYDTNHARKPPLPQRDHALLQAYMPHVWVSPDPAWGCPDARPQRLPQDRCLDNFAMGRHRWCLYQ